MPSCPQKGADGHYRKEADVASIIKKKTASTVGNDRLSLAISSFAAAEKAEADAAKEADKARAANAVILTRLKSGDATVSTEQYQLSQLAVQRADMLWSARQRDLAAARNELEVEQSDDELARMLADVVAADPYAFRTHGWDIDVRTRPGKDRPACLPQVAFCQQEATTHGWNGAASGTVWVYFYAEAEEALRRDFGSMLTDALRDNPSMSVQGVGNAYPTEQLDGFVRRPFRVEITHALLPVPVMTQEPTERSALHLASAVADVIRSTGLMHDERGMVVQSRKVRAWTGDCSVGAASANSDGTFSRTVAVTVGSQRSDHADMLVGVLKSKFVGSFASGLGRVTSARLLHTHPTGPTTFEFSIEFEVTYRDASTTS